MRLIEREAEHARMGRPARIIAKMNALLDVNIIRALYSASQAGVEIELLVRGMCALRPGIRGISDRIRVRSIVGRFLEHSRIFYFENGGRGRSLCRQRRLDEPQSARTRRGFVSAQKPLAARSRSA